MSLIFLKLQFGHNLGYILHIQVTASEFLGFGHHAVEIGFIASSLAYAMLLTYC